MESYAEGVRAENCQSVSPHPENPPLRRRPMANRFSFQRRSPFRPFRIGEAARGRDSVAVARRQTCPGSAGAMDNKTFGKMKKGRLKPDARASTLHGRTVERGPTTRSSPSSFRARREATGLVLGDHRQGREGAALPPVERGILRRQAPHWLTLPPLSSAVLDVSPAHRRHGGDGAFYVYLTAPPLTSDGFVRHRRRQGRRKARNTLRSPGI